MANYNSDYTGAQIDSAVSRANSTDVTAGTVAASKAVVVDSNKDITGFRHITATGTVTAANVSLTGNVDLGDASGDTVTITGSIDSNLIPAADDTYDIGSATYAWQDLFLEGDITLSDAGTIATTAGDLTINAGSGEIVFGNENLTTTGTIDSGSQAVTGNVVASGTVQAEQLTTTDDLTVSGLATIGETLAVTGVVTAAGFTIGSAVINEAELETIDGITAGTVIASKAIVTDSNIDITGGRNITISGELDAATLDISGNADIDGTLEADAYTVDGTALNEYIADTVGAMVSSNTETNITVSYEDGDNTLDFVIGTLNQDTTGTADNITVSANNSSDETVYPIFVDGATGSQGAESDTGLTYNPSSGLLTSTLFAGTLNTAAQGNVTSLGTLTALTVDNIAIDGTTIGHTGDTDLITLTSGVVTVAGEVDATSLDISGNADIDGTLEADAITVDGTTLAEYISDTTGAMFSSNTESGITVTYQDGDNTVDLSVDAAQTGITSLLATDIKIGEDDQTKIDFEDADKINFYAGNEKQLILEDGALYPGSDNIIDLGKSDNEFKDAFFDGTVTADAFAGPLTGAVTGNADTATLATTVTVSDSTANTNFPVVFHNESNALLDDTGALRYNPSTGELLVPKLTVAGATTTVDTVTMNASNAIIFEGATADSNETTLSIVDPTADHTQYLVNQGGYIPVLAAATTTAISATPEEINLIDGGTARGTTAVASGDGILINDGGTMRMTNVDTVSTYFSSHNVGGSNIVTTGALASGSIASGFGTISTGNAITTTAAITGGSFVTGTLTVDDGSITDSDGAISFGDENLSTTGTLGAGAITGTSLTLTEGNITNAGDINADSLSVDDAAVGLNIDFGGNTTLNKISLTDNLADALNITESSNSYLKFVTANSGEKITLGKKLEAGSVEIEGSAFDINGGNIDGTAIGSASASTGAFTTISATGNITMADDTSIGISDSDERIEFDGAGDISVLGANFGIGTTSPDTQLEVEGAGDQKIQVKSTDEDAFVLVNGYTSKYAEVGFLENGANRWYICADYTDSDKLKFGLDPAGASTKMTINSSGYVGIGLDAPTEKFHVLENVSGDWVARIEQNHSTGHGLIVEHAGSSDSYYGLAVYDGSNFDFVVKNGGSVGIGTASPGYKLDVSGDVKINQDSNSTALYIDSEATTQHIVHIDDPVTTTGNIIRVASANALTTGSMLYLHSASTTNDGRNLVDIINDEADADGTKCLNIRQDAGNIALRIEQNANHNSIYIDGDNTTQSGIAVHNNSLTTGAAGYFYSSNTRTADYPLVEIQDDDASAGGYGLKVRVDGDGDHIRCMNGSTVKAYISNAGNGVFDGAVIGSQFYSEVQSCNGGETMSFTVGNGDMGIWMAQSSSGNNASMYWGVYFSVSGNSNVISSQVSSHANGNNTGIGVTVGVTDTTITFTAASGAGASARLISMGW